MDVWKNYDWFYSSLYEVNLPQDLVKPYPLCRVVYQHGLDQVKELLMVFTITLLVFLQQLAVFSDILPSRAVLVPHQLPCAEVFCLCPPCHPTKGCCISPYRPRYHVYLRCREGSQDLFHHCKMLPIVMGLEKCESEVQLKHYASHTPDIAWLRPSQLQNDLRSPVNLFGQYKSYKYMSVSGAIT